MANRKKPQTKARKKWMEGKCPICTDLSFKDSNCPHSFVECEEEVQYQELYQRIRDDLKAELGLR